MNLEHTIKEIEEEFTKKVNEVSRDTHWGDKANGPMHDFGFKTQRELDGITELFTVTDFGNIQSFLKQALIRVAKEVAEAAELDEAWHKERGYILKQVSEKEEGWNAAITQQRDQLQAYMGEI